MKDTLNLNSIDKIVILSMIPNTIGDSLFLTPLFKIIKKNYPGKYLAVTASKTSSELFNGNTYVDEIIEIPELSEISKNASKLKKAFIYLNLILKTSRILKKKKFDLIIVNQPNFPPLQIVPKLSGIRYSIGFVYKGSIFSFMLSKKVKFHDGINYPNRHFIESNLDLLTPLNVNYKDEDKLIVKSLSDEEIKNAKRVLKENSIVGKFVCIQAGAKWKSKQWPKENFRLLVDNIVKLKYKVILLGSESEYQLNEFIKNENKDAFNLSGRISLNEVSAILKLSECLVGNDSGLTHLAAAVGTSTITIYGTTSYYHSKPLGKNKSIAIFPEDKPTNKLYIGKLNSEHNEIMNEISEEKVFKELKKLLK